MMYPPQPRRFCRSQSGIAGCSRVLSAAPFPWAHRGAPTPPSPTPCTFPRPHAARRQPAVVTASSRVSLPHALRHLPAIHAADAAEPAVRPPTARPPNRPTTSRPCPSSASRRRIYSILDIKHGTALLFLGLPLTANRAGQPCRALHFAPRVRLRGVKIDLTSRPEVL